MSPIPRGSGDFRQRRHGSRVRPLPRVALGGQPAELGGVRPLGGSHIGSSSVVLTQPPIDCTGRTMKSSGSRRQQRRPMNATLLKNKSLDERGSRGLTSRSVSFRRGSMMSSQTSPATALPRSHSLRKSTASPRKVGERPMTRLGSPTQRIRRERLRYGWLPPRRAVALEGSAS